MAWECILAARDATDQVVPDAAIGNLLLLLTIFVLAVFVGFEIITKIPPTLHTPLMSGSNAISGITLIGALQLLGSEQSAFAQFLAFLAIVLATVNVVGGFCARLGVSFSFSEWPNHWFAPCVEGYEFSRLRLVSLEGLGSPKVGSVRNT